MSKITEQQILKVAKEEIEKNNSVGYIPLPRTKSLLIRANKGVPLSVEGLRTWSSFKKKSFQYLIVRFYPNTYKEDMIKKQL